MRLLKLNAKEIELMKSKLSVKRHEKGVQISTHMSVDVLNDLLKNNRPNAEFPDTFVHPSQQGTLRLCFERY